jgi:hypothetical protein
VCVQKDEQHRSHKIKEGVEEFEDTKGVTRIRISKNRKHNGQKKKNRQHNGQKKKNMQHNGQKKKKLPVLLRFTDSDYPFDINSLYIVSDYPMVVGILQALQCFLWPKEEEQATQWPKEEGQTTQWPKEEEQATQWPKEEEQATRWPKEEEQTTQWRYQQSLYC